MLRSGPRLVSIIPSVLTLPLFFGILRSLDVRRAICHAATIGLACLYGKITNGLLLVPASH